MKKIFLMAAALLLSPSMGAARPCSYYLRDDTHLGAGAFASVFIPKDSVVYEFTDAVPGQKTYLSVQVSETDHVDDAFLAKLNHSCDPTIKLDTDRRVAVAARDIQPGELLTFFYPSTEWEMAQPFRCQCGSDQCIGLVQGAKFLALDTFDRHSMSEHIRRLKTP